MTTKTPRQMEGGIDIAARRAARLAAVQAIYQMELTELDAESVIAEFVAHRFRSEDTPAGVPDEAFFSDIVRGVPHRQSDIDRAIAQSLASDWSLSRIDSILRAILRAAVYELIARGEVPAKSVIDEYLEITHAFFQGDEFGFVNAALDKIAHHKREMELGKARRDDGTRS
ncbi:MAG TPA: transcription antitermination factor NusB [Rhizomicrobium sp.]|nr:transcription antitermination factor NusB [Rhizomicrobium sp.]